MDVTVPAAPAGYEAFRDDLRALIAAKAPKPPAVRKAGMRTPDAQEEVDELKHWLLVLDESGFSPRTLSAMSDPWPCQIAIEELDAARVPFVIGNPLIESAIVAHGTDEQKQKFLPGLRSGQEIWCQLFSEPGAGSDLAGLQTRAERDGDVYRINGQKVWTTWGQWSDYGYLLARTDPSAEKHAGISVFAIDMRQPGVDVRPLREITGTSDFNEVFFTDAIVPAANLIGGEGNGWRISSASLAAERSHQGGIDRPLEEQVRDLVAHVSSPVDADAVTRLYERAHIQRLLDWRAASRHAHGDATPAEAAVLKLMFSTLDLDVSVAALRLLGARGVLVEGDPLAEQRGRWQDMFLYARGYTISGGSNEIMRNVIAERGLGMPRDKSS